MSLQELFRGLFRRTEVELEEPAASEPERTEIKLPDFHRGAPIEVMTQGGTVLFTGVTSLSRSNAQNGNDYPSIRE